MTLSEIPNRRLKDVICHLRMNGDNVEKTSLYWIMHAFMSFFFPFFSVFTSQTLPIHFYGYFINIHNEALFIGLGEIWSIMNGQCFTWLASKNQRERTLDQSMTITFIYNITESISLQTATDLTHFNREHERKDPLKSLVNEGKAPWHRHMAHSIQREC